MRRISSPVAGMKAPYVFSGAAEAAARARGNSSLLNMRADLAKEGLLRLPTLHSRSQAMAAEADRKLRRAWQVFLPAPDAATRRQNASASSLLRGWAHSYAHRFPARAHPASAPRKGWRRNWRRPESSPS